MSAGAVLASFGVPVASDAVVCVFSGSSRTLVCMAVSGPSKLLVSVILKPMFLRPPMSISQLTHSKAS